MNTTTCPDRSTSPDNRPIACRACDLNAVCRIMGLMAYENGRPRQAMGALRTLRAGTQLVRAGEPAHSLFAVRQGTLKLTRITPDGDERIVSFVMPGETLGLEAFGSSTYTCDAVALDTVQYCELPLPPLDVRSAQHSALTAELVRLLSRNVAAHTDPARGSALQRVSNFLLDLSRRMAQRGFSATQLKLSMSRLEIANYLDTRIETVSRTLQQLHRQQAVQVRGNRVQLLTLLADQPPAA